MYARDLNISKYQFLIEKRENIGIKYFNDPNDLSRKKKRKKSIVFDDMIADIMTNRRFQVIIKELFIRCIKLNISLLLLLNLISLFQKMSD